MSLLLESIRLVDGCWMNINYHQNRMTRSSIELFGKKTDFDIDHVVIPDECRKGVVKCRILYDNEVRQVGFEVYQPRKISSLKLVYDDQIDYSYKWADRTALNLLLLQKNEADEILIVKNGELTDISYANIALRMGDKLFTPMNCLLKGTRRQQLIDEGLIETKILTVEDLKVASSVVIINAMLGLEDGVEVPIEKVLF